MELEAGGIGGEGPASQPRPLDRVLALLDVLLAGAALVVEGDNPLGRARQIGDDEANARVQLARMPFDLCHDVAGLVPALRLIAEAGVVASYLVRRSPNRASSPPSTRPVDPASNPSPSTKLRNFSPRIEPLGLAISRRGRSSRRTRPRIACAGEGAAGSGSRLRIRLPRGGPRLLGSVTSRRPLLQLGPRSDRRRRQSPTPPRRRARRLRWPST
jgi:hypothetical protein